MAGTKISELTELTTPTGEEELVYAKDGQNGKIKVKNLPSGGGGNGGIVPLAIKTNTNVSRGAMSLEFTNIVDGPLYVTYFGTNPINGSGVVQVLKNNVEVFNSGVLSGSGSGAGGLSKTIIPASAGDKIVVNGTAQLSLLEVDGYASNLSELKSASEISEMLTAQGIPATLDLLNTAPILYYTKLQGETTDLTFGEKIFYYSASNSWDYYI